jgi:DNA repair ATPase RecN
MRFLRLVTLSLACYAPVLAALGQEHVLSEARDGRATVGSTGVSPPAAQDGKLTASTLPQFLDGYEQTLRLVDAAFADILNEKMPLRDESGKPVGRRNLEDCHKQVAELRDAGKQLAAAPQDLALLLNFSEATEKLADEVYDLSQTAFDNDLEELGSRLSRLLPTIDHDQDALAEYALGLADEKQKRITELERQVQELEDKLKQTAEKPKPTPSPQ